MRVLFVLKQMALVRHFTSVVQMLAARDHVVRLAFQDGGHGLPPGLEGHPKISATVCASKRGDAWQEDVSLVRRGVDYLRYLTPPFAHAGKLRARAFDKLARTLSNGVREAGPGAADVGLALTEAEQARLRHVAGRLERLIPPDESIKAFIRHEAPDVVLISPLIDLGSGQADYVTACHALGVPVGMVLFSWDNLTTKGLIHEVPDRVFVWNTLQVREAVEMHGVPEKKLVVTGAPRFDEFFALQPSIDRETFFGHLGLDPGNPAILYLGSSKFVAEHEETFIRRWLDMVRGRPGLAGVNVIVKPHPDVNRDWGSEGERVSWPARGGDVKMRVDRPFADPRAVVVRSPFSGAQFLYDCLAHSAAVVGLNTSAEIEAGILGRPVLTVKAPGDLVDGQESTLHFHYLLKERGGFVERAPALDEHGHQLERALAGAFDAEAIKRFIESFIRPAGLDVPATKVFVRAVEKMAKAAEQQAKKASATPNHADATAAPADPGAKPASSEIVDLDYAPVRIRLRVTSDAERNWRARSCRKEPWTVEWIERNIRNESVLYDIGANVGTFTLIAACRQPTASVLAFEPGYSSYAHLCDNLVLNQCQSNVIPVPLPLWSSTALLSLKYRSTEPGASRHGLRQRTTRRAISADRYEQPVMAVRLDDLVTQYDFPRPTAIKLDVDGGEVEVLKGAAETLRSPSLQTMLVEVDEALTGQVTALLHAAGLEQVAVVERSKASAPAYIEFRRGARR